MKKMNFLFLLSFLLLSWSKPIKGNYDVLILNANIVDVEKGIVLKNKFIAIDQDTIKMVGNMAQLGNITATKRLDVKSKFVMPGLWDNHVHFRGGDALIQENKDLLPLFLAYGVTTVRDAGGDMTPEVMQWRKDIKAGILAGPTIFTSGPKLDGIKPAWAGSFKVENLQDAKKALDSLQEIGADYAKMYDGSLTKEAFYTIIKEAEKRGLKTTGHMPLTGNILDAVNYGLDGSEHLYYVLKACSPKADSLDRLNLGYNMMGTLVETYDPILAQKVYSQLGKKQFFVTPTLHVGQVLANILTTDHSKDNLLPYMGKGIVSSYQGRIQSAKRASASGATLQAKTEKIFNLMVLPMYQSGINIMAGSDCGASNSYVYPGESIHSELKLLVKAGLSPQQALRTSIVSGPKFFNKGKYYGTVAKGKIADLLILDADPLRKIENIDQVNTVVKNGRIYSKTDLTKMMQAVKK